MSANNNHNLTQWLSVPDPILLAATTHQINAKPYSAVAQPSRHTAWLDGM